MAESWGARALLDTGLCRERVQMIADLIVRHVRALERAEDWRSNSDAQLDALVEPVPEKRYGLDVDGQSTALPLPRRAVK